MLTHPFFWCENNKLFANFIKDSDSIFTIFETEVEGRKLEWLHGVKVIVLE